MPLDLPNLLIGLALAAVPCWAWPGTCNAASPPLTSSACSSTNASPSPRWPRTGSVPSSTTAVRKSVNSPSTTPPSRPNWPPCGESELLGAERKAGREALAAWSEERERKEGELRRLDSERAALAAELREQQESHAQRLADLQAARDDLRAQFAELAGKIFDEREQRTESSQQRLGQMLDPLKERIQAFEKRVEESYQQEARERSPWARSWSACSSSTSAWVTRPPTSPARSRARRPRATGVNWCWSGCWSMPAWRRAASTRPRSA